MKKKIKSIPNTIIFLVMTLIFFVGFISGSFIAPVNVVQSVVNYNYTIDDIAGKKIEVGIPAVDANRNGVIGKLFTTVRPALNPGNGVISFSINHVLEEADTQLYGRLSAKVASDYTNIDLKDYDILYEIKANATMVGGPSASAAMTASIIAALQNKTLDRNAMLTGTINEDGTIGEVGAILAKATAAKKYGITKFLVPPGLSYVEEFSKNTECSTKGNIELCETSYSNKKINIGDKLGIEVVEVSNINETLNHFVL